jgi:hypothetical protein
MSWTIAATDGRFIKISHSLRGPNARRRELARDGLQLLATAPGSFKDAEKWRAKLAPFQSEHRGWFVDSPEVRQILGQGMRLDLLPDSVLASAEKLRQANDELSRQLVALAETLRQADAALRDMERSSQEVVAAVAWLGTPRRVIPVRNADGWIVEAHDIPATH